MLPIYQSNQIKQWDAFTIQNEPISSTKLMERAASACVDWIVKNFNQDMHIGIVCGTGNNGGDGLVIARLLVYHNFKVKVYYQASENVSQDHAINFEALGNLRDVELMAIDHNSFNFKEVNLIIDCIFGTGLNKKIDGFWAKVVNDINQSEAKVLSIDIPSGLFSEPMVDISDTQTEIVKADITLTFQSPKLSMLLPDWGQYCGELYILDIGLSKAFVEKNPSPYFFVTQKDIQDRFKKREKFSHKGTYGHALIMAGSKGKCGAAILSSKACIKSGVGLVTLKCEEDGVVSIHTSIPEVMQSEAELNSIEFAKYSAIGIGPGIGINKTNTLLLENIFAHYTKPILLDADAISIIADQNINLQLPQNTVLTPHPKEFDRLVGESENAFQRLLKAQKFAIDKKVIVVLKGAYTAVCSPDGSIYFNSTGNAGMAKAGSGDVLTGIITSFLAQGYLPLDAAICGVYIHGWAGDLAAKSNSVTGMVASDIIENLNRVFGQFEI